jgi:N-acetylneuraminic acid mutarotase
MNSEISRVSKILIKLISIKKISQNNEYFNNQIKMENQKSQTDDSKNRNASSITNKEINNNTSNIKSEYESTTFIQKHPYIYMIGGRSRGKTLAKIERYSIKHNKWEKCVNLTDARGSTAACSVEPFIYIMGGGGIKSNLSSCEKLNTLSNQWEKFDEIAVARHALSAVAVGDRIFLIGGWIAGTISAKNVELFDTKSAKWKQLANLLVPRRLHGIAYFEQKNQIFIFGGQTNLGVIDDVECYIINEDKWEIKNSIPQAGCTQAVCVNGNVYVLLMPKCVYRYDYIDDTYEKVQNGDFPLEEWYGFSAIAFEGKIYVLGGTSKGRYCEDVYSFDTESFVWEKLERMYTARRRSSAVLIDA